MRFISSKMLLSLSLGIILIIGAYLRLYKIGDYLTFLGDEGRDVLIVKRLIVDHDFVLLGPTASVGGFFLGPMYYYFMAPFLWLWKLDPVGPAVMVALFGIATIYLIYRVGKDFFHPFVGIVAAALYAVSPLVIAYSRSSWNPNLVPFFSLLLIYFLWKFAVDKKYTSIFFIGLICGLGLQFHYLFSFLMIFTVLFLALDILLLTAKKKTLLEKLREYLSIGIVGIAGFVITFSPFILFELRHQFPNTQALIKFFLAGNETGFTPGKFFETMGDVMFRSYGRLLFRMPNYELWNGFPTSYISLLTASIRTSLYVSLLLLGTLSLRYVRYFPTRGTAFMKKRFPLTTEQWFGACILLLWFVFSVFMFGFYRRNIYDYYFGIFYAFPFLALSIIFWQLSMTKSGFVFSALIVVGLIYYNWQGRPFVYPPNKQLEQTKTIAKAALDMTQNQPYNFALITATNSDQAYRYFFEIWGRKPVTIEQPALDPDRKTVTDQLIVMCENPVCQPLGNPLWEVAGFGRAEVVEEKEVFPVKLVRLVHYKESK